MAEDTLRPDESGESTESGDTTPKTKKRRSRTHTIDLSSGVVDLTSGSTSNGDSEKKPKRATRSKAKASDDETTPEVKEEATPKRRRRTRRKVEDEPVASSDDPNVEASEDAPSDEESSGGRNRRRKKRKKGGGDSAQGGGHPGEEFDGILELIGDKKFGFIRGFKTSLQKGDNDPFMPPPLIQKYKLRDGIRLKGIIKPGRKGAWQVTEVHEVMGGEPEAWAETQEFDDGLVIYPEEKLQLVTDRNDVSMRVIDMVAPLGKGQRALIVAPPRAGKTVLLKGIAAGLEQNHPNVKIIVLLIDERPEEVTDFRRNTEATVFASSNDFGEDNHVRVATLAFEYGRRLVEQGHDVVILLDSLTRLGRTFNLFGGNSGRTMSGGLDARALLIPRKIFGSARNIEDGGSLTIIATALIETGSRMDEVIFEEFKGTGNSEVVLDREMAEQRMYPAINIRKSGTRNEDRLVDETLLRQRHMLLRALNSRHPVEAMQALAKQIQLSESNEELLNALIPESA
ncbi:MAG: transcription termination factor Rho [Bacteroidota bacterium]